MSPYWRVWLSTITGYIYISVFLSEVSKINAVREGAGFNWYNVFSGNLGKVWVINAKQGTMPQGLPVKIGEAYRGNEII